MFSKNLKSAFLYERTNILVTIIELLRFLNRYLTVKGVRTNPNKRKDYLLKKDEYLYSPSA